jgi:hypothetical protein
MRIKTASMALTMETRRWDGQSTRASLSMSAPEHTPPQPVNAVAAAEHANGSAIAGDEAAPVKAPPPRSRLLDVVRVGHV